jgi:hypothetical protein
VEATEDDQTLDKWLWELKVCPLQANLCSGVVGNKGGFAAVDAR